MPGLSEILVTQSVEKFISGAKMDYHHRKVFGDGTSSKQIVDVLQRFVTSAEWARNYTTMQERCTEEKYSDGLSHGLPHHMGYKYNHIFKRLTLPKGIALLSRS